MAQQPFFLLLFSLHNIAENMLHCLHSSYFLPFKMPSLVLWRTNIPETITSSHVGPLMFWYISDTLVLWSSRPSDDECTEEQRFPSFHFGLCTLNWPWVPSDEHFPPFFQPSLPLISSPSSKSQMFLTWLYIVSKQPSSITFSLTGKKSHFLQFSS